MGLGDTLQYITKESEMYNLDNKTFKTLSNTDNGDAGRGTFFFYRQKDDIVWASYSGGMVVKGHLIAKVLENGQLDMTYHHVDRQGELRVGKCLSTPKKLANGRLLFKEEWQWLNGDHTSGYSEIVEVSGREVME